MLFEMHFLHFLHFVRFSTFLYCYTTFWSYVGHNTVAINEGNLPITIISFWDCAAHWAALAWHQFVAFLCGIVLAIWPCAAMSCSMGFHVFLLYCHVLRIYHQKRFVKRCAKMSPVEFDLKNLFCSMQKTLSELIDYINKNRNFLTKNLQTAGN